MRKSIKIVIGNEIADSRIAGYRSRGDEFEVLSLKTLRINEAQFVVFLMFVTKHKGTLNVVALRLKIND